mgnify:CR=1 FL=1
MNLTSSFGKLFSSVKLTLGLALTITFMSASISTHAQDIENVKPVKNVIVLIPDGCSLATVSAARWYQWYMNPDIEKLAIDPYLCGTVRTTCSNAPIGDSAPTTSAYMTGYNSLAGWVSTYPVSKGKDDIYPMDPAKAYQPLTTVLEAAKMLKGKATGLVCTCYFTNATPADCSAHSHDRNSFTNIASQQVHNGVNVVIGGGVRYMTAEHEKYLTSKGVTVLKNDIDGMRNCTNNNMWALFRSGDMSHDLDRDPSKEPSLAEMTETAISKLSTDPDGFFLMVEGSEVDYCAHDNDLIGMVTEFLAFDKACKVALDFAKKNGETAVVILPDHGNSGLSLGRRDWGGYATMPMDRQFGAMAKFKATCGAIADKLNRAPFEQAQDIFKEWCGFRLKDSEIEALKNNKVALISCGWDPGMFSLNRLYANAILNNGKDYTFWGKGVSQGHSDACRRVEGVADARQYTVPVPEAVESVRNGENPELTTRQKHTRLAYIVAKEGADKAKIEKEIKEMPNYFSDYDTTVVFISQEEMDRDHKGLPHGGSVIRTGVTGMNGENKHVIEYNLKLDSNPEFTGAVLVAYARAVDRMNKEGMTGCKTVFDVAPAYLINMSAEDMRAHLL